MDLLHDEEIRNLVNITDDTCVSIYMPTHKTGYDQQQDPIRFKNLLDEIEKRLIKKGMRSPEALTFLSKSRDLLLDGGFWRHQSDGLVVFIAPEETKRYRLPINFDELVYIDKKFYIKPLLPLLSGDGQFFVLSISLNHIRLFQGTRFTITDVDIGDTPTSIADALWFEDPESQLQWHTLANNSAGLGKQTAIFHGQGGFDNFKDNILRYFRKVNESLSGLLRVGKKPLILAGVDYLLPIYQEANTYGYLLGQGIPGNPDQLTAKDLHGKAWEIVKPFFDENKHDAIDRYHALAGKESNEASNNVQEVLKAAFNGRVDTLFVAMGVQLWGRFNRQSLKVTKLHTRFSEGDEDFLELAVTFTMQNSGEVYGLDPHEVPGGKKLAAIFRYGY